MGGTRQLNTNDLEQLPSTENVIDAGTLVSDVDDWNPTDFDIADIIKVDISSNNTEITGMIAPTLGVNRIVSISNNNGAGNDIRFTHNDGSSLAANRFLLRDNNQKSIKPNETGQFWYDHGVNRWKPFNRIG
jgi:hypothetical protein